MHPALQGALVGLAVSVFLVVVEYFYVQKAVKERAARFHRAAEMDPTERRRLAVVTRFSLFVPPAFALAFWLLAGI